AGIARHRRTVLTRERALILPVDVLHAEQNVLAIAQRESGDDERDCRGEDDYRPIVGWWIDREKFLEIGARFLRAEIHFPVGGEHRLLHASPASSSAATPGSSLPSRNSSDAPPPVET